MSSLFNDLYCYRQRETKNNYEDWLTECLAAILRALPTELFSTFLGQLTGQPPDVIADIHPHVTVATQVIIPREGAGTQRPDILVTISAPAAENRRPAQPWLLFENKVWHHVDERVLETGEVESQLHRYGKWLQGQQLDRPGLQKSLVYISHGTPVPDGFFPGKGSHQSFEGLGRSSSTWGDLARALAEQSRDYPETLHFKALISAYQIFLEEHGMAEEYPEYMDFATLAGFIDIVDPFSRLVDEMLGKLSDLARFQGRAVKAMADAEEGTFHAWRNLAEESRFDGWTFVSTGFWFPDRGDGFYLDDLERVTGRAVSLEPKAYIQFAHKDDDALKAIKGTPGEEWHRLNSDFLVMRDVSSFPPAPNDRAMAVLAWVEEEGSKMKALLSAE